MACSVFWTRAIITAALVQEVPQLWNVAMVRKHESRLCSCNGLKELPHNACLQKMLCKFRKSYLLQEYSCILEIALNSESKPLVIKKMSPELDVALSSL